MMCRRSPGSHVSSSMPRTRLMVSKRMRACRARLPLTAARPDLNGTARSPYFDTVERVALQRIERRGPASSAVSEAATETSPFGRSPRRERPSGTVSDGREVHSDASNRFPPHPSQWRVEAACRRRDDASAEPTRATATAVSMTGGTRTFCRLDRLVLLQLAVESAPHCLLHERIRASGLTQPCSPDYCRRGTEPCIHHASCSPTSRCQEPMD